MKNPKIFIATPTFDGKVHTQYLMGIVSSVVDLKSNGVDIYLVPNLSSTLLVLGRNTLLEAFLTTDATHIMCIDSDLGFNDNAISVLLNADKDFIAGVYPSRKATTFIYNPVYADDGSLIPDEKHPYLIKANMVSSGFMLIKREVIVKMREHFAHLSYKPKVEGAGDTGVCLFNTEVIDGEFWSEDYVFCKRARDAGFDIWIDPRIQFNHAGTIGSLNMLPEIKQHLEKLIPMEREPLDESSKN